MTFTAVEPSNKFWSSISTLMGAFGLLVAGILGSWGLGNLPLSLALSALGLLAGAAILAACGASASRGKGGPEAFAALSLGLVIAGLAGSAVGLIQVYAPDWTDGLWISRTNRPGIATGNVRQPNHLSGLLLWSLVGVVALHELRRLPLAWLWVAAAPIVSVIELTGSRFGALGLVLLALWAVIDRRLSRGTRWLLGATPMLYAISYGLMALRSNVGQEAAGSRLRGFGTLGPGDVGTRLIVWRDAIAMIEAQPWTGVGFGEFNLAWTLSPLSPRPGQYYDNSHNLVLQLAVELGLPLAALVISLLLLALWHCLSRARRTTGDDGLVARAGLVMLLIVALHSMVEYPLWLAYFLLPAALAWGLVLGLPDGAPALHKTDRPKGAAPSIAKSVKSYWGLVAGLVMSLAGAWSILDYLAVTRIYTRGYSLTELPARIEQGQKSLLFAHFADYTAAASAVPEASKALGFSRAAHRLVDPLFMMLWSTRLATQGQTDQARWIAQRLRDFESPEATAFFGPCRDNESTEFQCEWPVAAHSWREFSKPADPSSLNQPNLPVASPAASSPATANNQASKASR